MGHARAEGASALRGLPAIFTYSQARALGLTERILYALRDQGLIESVGRGLYRRHDWHPGNADLTEIALRAPNATLCLTTALAMHQLTDDIPSVIDVALPRGRHRPAIGTPVSWHAFDPATFDIGREVQQLDDGEAIGVYSAERSIIDAFRLRYREGAELGTESLKRWLRRPESSPAQLLVMARKFPQGERALRQALEILL